MTNKHSTISKHSVLLVSILALSAGELMAQTAPAPVSGAGASPWLQAIHRFAGRFHRTHCARTQLDCRRGGRADVRLRGRRQQEGPGRNHLRPGNGHGRGQLSYVALLMERGKTWRGYPALSKPLTIMGVERRWFLLSATLGLALWNAINSIVVGALIFAVLYGVGFWAWKQDPNMLEILRASAQFRARYDPGKWAEAPWTLLIRR